MTAFAEERSNFQLHLSAWPCLGLPRPRVCFYSVVHPADNQRRPVNRLNGRSRSQVDVCSSFEHDCRMPLRDSVMLRRGHGWR